MNERISLSTFGFSDSSSGEDSPGVEHDGYDPIHSEIIEDSNRAYRPRYFPSESGGGPSSDDFTDDDAVESHTAHKFANAPTTSTLSDFPGHSSEGSLHSKDKDREYHIEPIIDVTTPAYAPSHAYESGSNSSPSSVFSDIDQALVDTRKREPNVHQELGLKQKKSLLEDLSESESDGDFNDKQHEESHVESSLRLAHANSPSNIQEHKNHTDSYNGFADNLLEDNEDDQEQSKFNEDFEGFERDEQPESQVDGIIADIFGESDAEEEFEGFAENEIDKGLEEEEVENRESAVPASVKKPQTTVSNEDDEESGDNEEFVSDFDKIMAQKREELRRKRRRNRDIEFLNDSDDLIIEMIGRMKIAADEDRQLLAAGRPATKKLSMCKEVTALLRRADLKAALIDNGMLSAITEWLSPLPGHTLPNLVIRDSMLTSLSEFQSLSIEVLQESGIGKALMYLYKHPRETRENKDKAGRLINEWLRPIFNLTSDYRTLTKEERKQLDYEHLPKRRNIDNEAYTHRDINRELDGDSKGVLRPGDPGWIGRARVPQPSNKDYIVRPKWRVSDNPTADDDEEDDGNEDRERNTQSFLRRSRKSGSSGFGASSRIEGHIRNLTNNARRSHAKTARAVPMSIEGRNMSL